MYGVEHLQRLGSFFVFIFYVKYLIIVLYSLNLFYWLFIHLSIISFGSLTKISPFFVFIFVIIDLLFLFKFCIKNKSFLCSLANLTVIEVPLFSFASMITTPMLSPTYYSISLSKIFRSWRSISWIFTNYSPSHF